MIKSQIDSDLCHRYGSLLVVTCLGIAPCYAISYLVFGMLSVSQCQGIAPCYATLELIEIRNQIEISHDLT